MILLIKLRFKFYKFKSYIKRCVIWLIKLKNKYLGIIFLLGCMGLNCYFYYSGIMTLPINVNENSLIMLNYQYIFYGIGSYAALN